MPEQSPRGPNRSIRRLKLAASSFAVFILLMTGAFYAAARIYLATPHASALASGLLTKLLGANVHISALHESGGGITLKGVSIANPPGYTNRPFLLLRSLSIRPAWASLLSSPRHIRAIGVDGLTVNLEKTPAGWNYAKFLKPGKKKEPGAEIVIDSLDLEDSAVAFNGTTIRDIKGSVTGFSSTGARTAEFKISAIPPTGGTVAVAGTFRGGATPTVNAALTAPGMEVDKAAAILRRTIPKQLQGSTADISATIAVAAGDVKLTSTASFVSPGPKPEIGGKAAIELIYTAADDTAEIRGLSLTLNGLSAAASGKVSSVKKDRLFRFNLDIQPLDLAEMAPFLPPKVIVAGKTAFSPIIIEGSGTSGISRLNGSITLERGDLSAGTTRVAGLSGEAKVVGDSSGIRATGDLRHSGTPLHALVKAVSAKFDSTFTRKLHLVAGTASIDSTVAEGKATATASLGDRGISGYLSATGLSVQKLAAVADPAGRKPDSGTLNLQSRFSGSSPREIKGSAHAELSDTKLRQGDVAHIINRMTVDGDWTLKEKIISFNGQAEASGKTGDRLFRLSVRPHLGDGVVTFERITGRYSDIDIISGALRLSLPDRKAPTQLLTASLVNLTSSSPLFTAKGVAGSARFFKGKTGWEGSAVFTADNVGVKGAGFGRQELRLDVADRAAKAVVSGAGGALTATALADPKDVSKGITFSGTLTDFPATTLGPLLGTRNPPQIREGLVKANFSGAYKKDSGLVASATVDGRDFTVADSRGRTLVSRAGIHSTVETAGKRLILRESRATIGDSIRLSAAGTIEEYASPQRRGKVSFAVAPAPANSFVDAFVNIMPPALQEATLAGSVAAGGEISFSGAKSAINGTLTITAASVELPGQKVHVTGIDGSIPFSARPGDLETTVATEHVNFSRDTYRSNLSALMVKNAASHPSFRIDRITFGAAELGPLTFNLHAADGVTHIDLLTAELYDGRLIGSGYLSFGGKQQFTFNSLVNDFSLRRLCDTYPSIKGYISGRVDGVLSFAGTGFRIPAMKGFLDLWTHEKKGEKKYVSKEFLQKLSGKKLKGIFFTNDRAYDTGEVGAYLDDGFLTFTKLDLSHTNLFGVKDLSVSVAPVQNRIAFSHLLDSIKEATARSKAVKGGGADDGSPPATEFKWQE